MPDNLRPPDVVDLIDAAVMASNNLLVYCLAIRETDRETIDHDVWDALVEADNRLNGIQDAFYRQHRPCTIYGEPHD